MAKIALGTSLALLVGMPALAENLLSLRGIQLGVPLETYVECPKKGLGALARYEDLNEPQARPCFAKGDALAMSAGRPFLELRGLPQVTALGTLAGIETIDGRIESVDIRILATSFSTVSDAAIQKYGKPSSSTVRDFTTELGSQASGRVLTWVLPGGVVRLEERRQGHGREWGFLSAASNAYLKSLEQRKQETTQQLKSAL